MSSYACLYSISKSHRIVSYTTSKFLIYSPGSHGLVCISVVSQFATASCPEHIVIVAVCKIAGVVDHPLSDVFELDDTMWYEDVPSCCINRWRGWREPSSC